MNVELKKLQQDFIDLQKQSEEIIGMFSASVDNCMKIHRHYLFIQEQVREAIKRLDLEIAFSEMQEFLNSSDGGDYGI
mgnify:CR=1 FL=1